MIDNECKKALIQASTSRDKQNHFGAKRGGVPGIEPGTSRTLSGNHTTRPNTLPHMLTILSLLYSSSATQDRKYFPSSHSSVHFKSLKQSTSLQIAPIYSSQKCTIDLMFAFHSCNLMARICIRCSICWNHKWISSPLTWFTRSPGKLTHPPRDSSMGATSKSD